MSPHPATIAAFRSTRRTAVVGAVAGVAALAGCDPEPAARPGATPEADPDTALVDAVRAELGEVAGLVAAAAGRPQLRERVTALLALHAAHLEAIEGDPPTPSTPPAGPPAQVWATLSARERQLQRRLADWSVRAESGALARLLASMSAGVAAHLAAGVAP